MTTLSLDLSTVKPAVWITLAYIDIYIIAILVQAKYKFAAVREHKKKDAKEPFLRYGGNPTTGTTRELHAADRCVGNQLEWMPVFLVLLWLSALLVPGATTVWLGWLYVLARALYVWIGMSGAIRLGGIKATMLLATGPSYISLFWMMGRLALSAL